ncbi:MULTISPECIES: hypothetical protein [Bacteroides]|uniref:hypothetical protein n=1 Tax=Bacteroides TaxID=816 RepID=UPI00214A0A99|nr:hypothetical protein [Bacteroides acidifaciens]MCR2007991.1 hypothetical protein [Bacteroides acidifaciens]
MITPKLKDCILSVLCSGELEYECLYHISKDAILESIPDKCTENELVAILYQFKRMGLISDFANNSSTVNLCLLIEASDFLARGGFYAQEELLKANIEKLSKELDLLSKQLKPDMLEKANLISSIGNSIVAALSLFKS